MADDELSQRATWPLPKFFFRVQWGSQVLSFQEVSRLEAQTQAIEYRHGGGQQFSPIKMPGLTKFGNVTMKKGIFESDAHLSDLMAQVKAGTAQRMTIVISLLDESGAPTMVWTLNNTWPTKITGTDLKSEGNEVAVESLEVAYEALSVST